MVIKKITVYESRQTNSEADGRAAELIRVLNAISDTALRLVKRLSLIERETARKKGAFQ